MGTPRHRGKQDRFRRRALKAAHEAGQATCPICRVWLDWEHAGLPASAEADHIRPIAAGGTDDPSNAMVICRRCNQSKGGRLGNARSRRTPMSNTHIRTSRQW